MRSDWWFASAPKQCGDMLYDTFIPRLPLIAQLCTGWYYAGVGSSAVAGVSIAHAIRVVVHQVKKQQRKAIMASVSNGANPLLVLRYSPEAQLRIP